MFWWNEKALGTRGTGQFQTSVRRNGIWSDLSRIASSSGASVSSSIGWSSAWQRLALRRCSININSFLGLFSVLPLSPSVILASALLISTWGYIPCSDCEFAIRMLPKCYSLPPVLLPLAPLPSPCLCSLSPHNTYKHSQVPKHVTCLSLVLCVFWFLCVQESNSPSSVGFLCILSSQLRDLYLLKVFSRHPSPLCLQARCLTWLWHGVTLL